MKRPTDPARFPSDSSGTFASRNRPESIQGSKVRSLGDEEAIAGIGREIAGRLKPRVQYLVGPGTTAKAVLRGMGLPFTLLGVDLLLDGNVIGTDLTAANSCHDG